MGPCTSGAGRNWRAGDVTEAAGLRVVDDHTLEMALSGPMPAWPFHMAAWNVGISKVEQVLSDEGLGECAHRARAPSA